MVRYADDFVACFEYRHEAESFEQILPGRLGKFGLEVAKDKTKTLRFGRNGGPHNGRFDFLGFEIYWEADRQGQPRVKRRTATKKHLAAMQRLREWIKTHRHEKIPRLMKRLKAKLEGTWNYYGLIGNYRRMKQLHEEAVRSLYKWLNRRSQRRSLRWRGITRLLQRFQVRNPRIVEQQGQRMPSQGEFSFCQRLLPWPLMHPKAHARAS